MVIRVILRPGSERIPVAIAAPISVVFNEGRGLGLGLDIVRVRFRVRVRFSLGLDIDF